MEALKEIGSLVSSFFGAWNVYTTVLFVVFLLVGAFTVYDRQSPDFHPFLIERQSAPGLVRHPGESVIVRSYEVPEGVPLRSGLGIRRPGQSAYATPQDGDIRDIWKRVTGELPIDRDAEKTIGKILTVFGKQEIVQHDIEQLTQEINVIGSQTLAHKVKRVAIYLPNSIEYLIAVFAGAFYGFTPILIPYNQPHDKLIQLLNKTKADGMIAAAGSLPLADVTKHVRGLRQVIWVVEKTSRHMDWSEVPEGIGGKLDVAVWHELVKDSKGNKEQVLPDNKDVPNIGIVWQNNPTDEGKLVEFTQKNIVAAVGAQISTIPKDDRLGPEDTFLPAESFSHSYVLVLTLAALFSQSIVAINSVAGSGVSVGLAIRNISPTILVLSAESASNMHGNAVKHISKGIIHKMQARALTQGRMPTESPIAAFTGTTDGVKPGQLRLMYISDRAGSNCPPLNTDELADLRLLTRARIIYGLAAAPVAGTVAQTHIFDYRKANNKKGHFGAPLSCLEIKLVDTQSLKTTDERATGEITVAGNSVAGGRASLGVTGIFRDDYTLAYV